MPSKQPSLASQRSQGLGGASKAAPPLADLLDLGHTPAQNRARRARRTSVVQVQSGLLPFPVYF